MTVAVFADQGFASAAHLQAGKGSVALAEDVKQEVIVDKEGRGAGSESRSVPKSRARSEERTAGGTGRHVAPNAFVQVLRTLEVTHSFFQKRPGRVHDPGEIIISSHAVFSYSCRTM